MKESFETGFRGHAREQGAATLMAVLFLLIVIAFAVLVATSMSGSDITDTSLGQSGVSALLLAESGIERAAARYVAGNSCATLAVDGPYALGQGSFTINASYTTDFSGTNLPAGECRVQSVGTVGLVQRTVQAILQLPASDGMVVGNGGTALRCGGSTCTSTKGIPGRDNLVGVSCPTSTDCIAVAGNNGDAFEWNGSAWSLLPSSGLTQFTAVACEPGNGADCYAVGLRSFFFFQIPEVMRWNGTRWNLITWAASPFTAIACAGTGAATTCYATTSGSTFWVGNGGGGSWLNANSPNPLNAVSCASAADCWATEGASWDFDALTTPAGGSQSNYGVSGSAPNLDAISCDATNDCWAAGQTVGRRGGQSAFVYWNGSTGTVLPSKTKRNLYLYGIDCLSSSECWAVGAKGTVLHGSGTAAARTWSAVKPRRTGQPLNAVSFPASSSGSSSAVVIQWHEIES